MNLDYQTIIIRSASQIVGELKTQRKEVKQLCLNFYLTTKEMMLWQELNNQKLQR